MESWKKFCPDYEVVKWDESNFDINSCKFVKEAYKEKNGRLYLTMFVFMQCIQKVEFT